MKAKIDSFVARGNTSIDIGTKWGTALLDPSTSSVLSNLIASNDVHGDFAGRPYAYGENNVLKVLVVMSDGQNTNQYYMNEPYRDGLSDVWLDANNAGTSDDLWSIYNNGNDDYYHQDTQSTSISPDGDPDAVQTDVSAGFRQSVGLLVVPIPETPGPGRHDTILAERGL